MKTFKKNRKLTCPNCGNINKKTFIHIDTETVPHAKAGPRTSRRIYQCDCGQMFTFHGPYSEGEAGGVVIKDDLIALEEGFAMMDNEYMNDWEG